MWRSLKRNRGKVIGGLSGLAIALLLIFAWPLVLIFILVLLGISLGGIFDAARKVGVFLDRLFSYKKPPRDD
ncbi:hypothetical protein LCGC14_2321450 [marine sediment metagenome]|uniref:DUF2273 domain-containing protein n=1 Tax=marine sediment metagenome TaxID=412755 RepID=A0A0F9EV70_9ZZZZ